MRRKVKVLGKKNGFGFCRWKVKNRTSWRYWSKEFQNLGAMTLHTLHTNIKHHRMWSGPESWETDEKGEDWRRAKKVQGSTALILQVEIIPYFLWHLWSATPIRGPGTEVMCTPVEQIKSSMWPWEWMWKSTLFCQAKTTEHRQKLNAELAST